MYAELSYFEGFHFAHIAAYDEHRRLGRIEERARRAYARERRYGSRRAA